LSEPVSHQADSKIACGVINITSMKASTAAPLRDRSVPTRASRPPATHSSTSIALLHARHSQGWWTITTSTASIGRRPVQV